MIVLAVITLVLGIILMFIYLDDNSEITAGWIGITLLICSFSLFSYYDVQKKKTPEWKNQHLKEQLWEIKKQKNKKKDLEQLIKENKVLQDSLYKLKQKL